MSEMRENPWARFFRNPFVRALGALLIIVLLGIIFNADGAFYKFQTHRDMLRQVSVYGILACGMTLVIISGGIDLAVGSILGLSAVSFALLAIHWGWPPIITIPICLLIGACMGALSGTMVALFRVQPFIMTLAVMVFARGVAKYVSGGQKISTYAQDVEGNFVQLEMPTVFTWLDARLFGDTIAVVTLIFLACIVFTWVLLGHTALGRRIYAIGGNEEAARLSGVPVGRTKVIVYGLSGAFASLAGLCQAAQEYQGDPESGATYELTAIAIVVIGGTSLSGGRGGILLTLLGAMTIGYLEKVLSINAVGEASRLMLSGAIIVGAVLFQRTRH